LPTLFNEDTNVVFNYSILSLELPNLTVGYELDLKAIRKFLICGKIRSNGNRSFSHLHFNQSIVSRLTYRLGF